MSKLDPRTLEYLDTKVSEAIDEHNKDWTGLPLVTVLTAELDALIGVYRECVRAKERYERRFEKL